MMMYDFATNPAMSLRSRVKRKFAKKEEYNFYGVGPYETSSMFNAIRKAVHLTTGIVVAAKVK
ncbi:hypothetical protein COOONC_09233 [Cooperia oncophora]